jgi:hypothetical protein
MVIIRISPCQSLNFDKGEEIKILMMSDFLCFLNPVGMF